MEIKYLVVRAYRYKESHNWEYSIVKMCDTIAEARQAFHSNMGAIIKDSNDHAMCIIFDTNGNKIDSDYVDTYVEPEPNEE